MDAPVLHHADRQLWVVPIRHHSPACAAHLERLIDAVAPAAILVEGPCDFDPLIGDICDPRTRPPVAVVSLREGDGERAPRRVASYFPFCAHSPELIALRAAASRNIPVRFIDLPSTDEAMHREDDQDRSLLGSERLFDVGDFVTALARDLGCRDGNEVWDTLFETRIADTDWRRFFTDVGHYCAGVRAATDRAEMARDGTLAREAQMGAIVAQIRRAVTGPIVAVVGGFHADALAEPVHDVPVAARPGGGRSYLIRYGMRQLDALNGYGAGLPLPGFYDRLWQVRERGGRNLAVDLITGFAAHLRKGGGKAVSFPMVAAAVEQAERLAALRDRPFPMRDDVVDAVRSTFIKGEVPVEQVPLLNELRAWLTGTAIGEVPPSAGSPPLVEAARMQARALGFATDDGERRTRELDIYRKPRHRAASRFCHAMTLIGTRFAERTGGPDFRNDIALDRLHETWVVAWSPMVEARLVEVSEAADTIGEALAFTLAHRLAALADQGQGRSALAAIDLFCAACRAGMGNEANAVLALIEEQVIADPDLGSVVSAFVDLLLLRRGRETVGLVTVGPLDHLVQAAWRRILLLLPDLAQLGPDAINEAIRSLSELRGAIDLARSSAALLDFALFDETLDDLSARPLAPMLAGAVTAFSLLGGRSDVATLEARLGGELGSGYVDPGERLAFLAGIIAIARELIWTVPAIVDTLDALVTGLDEDAFVALVPFLRLALMSLDPREIDRLGEEVAARRGGRPGSLAVFIDIPETELAENLRFDRELAAMLERDGVA